MKEEEKKHKIHMDSHGSSFYPDTGEPAPKRIKEGEDVVDVQELEDDVATDEVDKDSVPPPAELAPTQSLTVTSESVGEPEGPKLVLFGAALIEFGKKSVPRWVTLTSKTFRSLSDRVATGLLTAVDSVPPGVPMSIHEMKKLIFTRVSTIVDRGEEHWRNNQLDDAFRRFEEGLYELQLAPVDMSHEADHAALKARIFSNMGCYFILARRYSLAEHYIMCARALAENDDLHIYRLALVSYLMGNYRFSKSVLASLNGMPTQKKALTQKLKAKFNEPDER